MNIIYCHHAQRIYTGSQKDDITDLGKKDAELVGQFIKDIPNVKAIYTSPYFRCVKTARIINKSLNVPIIEEDRFNEFVSKENKETWVDLQKRVIAGIKDIVNKYNDEDTIICVTSGVNIAGFLDWNLGLKPSENMPFLGIISCSPIIFKYNKKV